MFTSLRRIGLAAAITAALLAVPVPAQAIEYLYWPGGDPPVATGSSCVRGKIESIVNGEIRGWTTACAGRPDPAFGFVVYRSQKINGKVLLWYGASTTSASEFRVYMPEWLPTRRGDRHLICLARTQLSRMLAPTGNSCIAVTYRQGALHTEPVTDSEMAMYDLLDDAIIGPPSPTAPYDPPNCATCLGIPE
jgi:hypothetical protein